jgi:hypothetical protein
VESNVIIGVLFAQGKVGNIGAEGCKKAGPKNRPFILAGDRNQFEFGVESVFQVK